VIIYTCWITCLLESYQDAIVAGLIKRGYTIGLSGRGNVNQHNQFSAVLSYSLYKLDDPDLTAPGILKEIGIILSDMKAYYYSIVVAEGNNAAWAGSNIIVQDNKTIPLLPAIPNKNSKLN
jgi:hypothetical protein